MTERKIISEFRGEYRFLSNFWTFKSGDRLISSEHWYQASKGRTAEMSEWVLEAETPGEAKKRGQQVELREDWEELKLPFMRVMLAVKFAADPLRKMLVDTGDAILIEGNRWGDTFWGVDLNTKEGENHLGILLMELRDQFQEEDRTGVFRQVTTHKVY